MSHFPTPYTPLDLSWLMRQPDLRLTPVVSRPVEFWGVQVSEIAHPETFIENGAVVLTVGLAFRGDLPGFIEAVRAMARSGAVAIGVGVGYAFDHIPDELIKATADLPLALFEVPREVSFASILAAVQAERTSRAASRERKLLRTLIRLNDAANAGDTVALVRGVAQSLDVTAALIDSDNRIIAHHGDDTLITAAVSLYSGTSKAVSADGVNYLFHKMRTRGTVHRAMAIASRAEFGFIDRVVIRHSAGLADLLLGRPQELAGQRAAVNEAAILVHLGRSGDESALHDLFRVVVDSRGLTRPAVVCTRTRKTMRAIRQALLQRAWEDGRTLFVAEVAPNTALYLVRGSTSEAEIVKNFQKWHDQVRLGIGAPIPLGALTGHSVDKLIAEARTNPAGYGKPGGHAPQWLFSPTVTAATQGRFMEVEEKLANSAKADELKEAVAAFLFENGNLGAAADRLGIHRHTMRARIGEAEGLLSTDLSHPLTRAELTLVFATRMREFNPPLQ